MVKYFKFTLPFYIVIFMGCASNTPFDEKAAVSKAGFSSGRQIVRTASLSLSVESLDEKVEEFSILTEKYDGYIEESNRHSKKRAGVKAKVPSENLALFLHDVAALGRVTNSSTSSKDVTDQVIDIDARLKNLIALRTRYRVLLDKANTVVEIVSIEKELSKVQTEIDSIEGRRSSLLDQVAMSRVNVNFKQKTIYGPLGYIGNGLMWVIGKLFVIE